MDTEVTATWWCLSWLPNATTGVAQSTPPQELVKLNGTASAVMGEAIGKPTAATPSTPNGYLLYVPHDTPASS